jgi:hypothetical protein
MPSQFSPELEENTRLGEAVRRADSVLQPILRERSQSAQALWSIEQDDRGRTVIALTLSDPWGYATAEFAENELEEDDHLRTRFDRLVGQMIYPRNARDLRTRIEIRDSFAPISQVDDLRLALGQIPDVEKANLQLRNRVQFAPGGAQRILLTDFAVEANVDFADAIRDAIERSGFHLRRYNPLIERPGVRDALKRLVERHLRDEEAKPDFAVCFRLNDADAIHLLEVSKEVVETEIGRIEGIGFDARSILPGVKELRFYQIHPADLMLTYESEPDAPFFVDLLCGRCEFLFPDHGEKEFRTAFPEIGR